MQVVIQNLANGLYLAADGWVENPDDGIDFGSARRASAIAIQ